MIDLYHADCFDILPTLQDGSVDLVLADLPYGTTQCAWDTELPLERLWAEYRRVCRGAVILFAQTPFDKVLGASNIRSLKYEWIWEKTNATLTMEKIYTILGTSARGTDMIFTKQARKSKTGTIFAPGKADISPVGYFDRADYAVYKLCENYDGQVRGGIRKTWRVVAKNLTLDQAKALLEKRAS